MSDNIKVVIVILVCVTIMTVIGIVFESKKLVDIDQGYVIFKDTGQIWADQETLTMYGYNGKNVEIGAGGGVVINAGSGSIEIRQGNDTKIKISENKIDINTDNLFINGKKWIE